MSGPPSFLVWPVPRAVRALQGRTAQRITLTVALCGCTLKGNEKMSDDFKPVLYLKENCPFCLKVRIFVLESGSADQVTVRDFTEGTEGETSVKPELSAHLDKVSFPAAQMAPGIFINESDDIIAKLEALSGKPAAQMTVYQNYVNGAFSLAMTLWRENVELKQAAASA
ncbi:glutathione S-transferase N-terminal domain-containing protein [Maritimibacter dapengensis]|nr:glutathione S-transferase N-terminal domain-containing protein [Maritimibacter dapengensis]